MERLTEKRDGQNVIPLRQNGKIKWAICSAGLGDAPTKYLYVDHADRLAAYEDTGLEPEEIELLAKQRDLYVDACGELPLKRIRELAQADREGRCGIPPVKMHQKVFRVFNGEIYEEIVCGAIWEPLMPQPRWKVFVMGAGLPYFWHEVLGKTVFLTRADAEAVLRREQDGQDD